jgi:hypothetical protein
MLAVGVFFIGFALLDYHLDMIRRIIREELDRQPEDPSELE